MSAGFLPKAAASNRLEQASKLGLEHQFLLTSRCCAGANQIDKPLLDLLQQNIDAARSAGQEQPAVFMEKIKAAAQRYRLSPA